MVPGATNTSNNPGDGTASVDLRGLGDVRTLVYHPKTICLGVGASRNCPPEDAGGAHGYQACIEGDLDWMDDNYDPAKFDTKLAQKRVAKVKCQ